MIAPAHRVIITGTGRNGTTFLIRLLTELGLNTGYTSENWSRDYLEHCNAGLEKDPADTTAPYIVKNPNLCETLPALLATKSIVIDHALVPIRDIEAAALSRIRVGGSDGSVPGGLWKTGSPSAQKAVLAELFHQLVLTLVAHDVPHTFLLFPRLVEDADYTFSKLAPLLDGVSREQFRSAFARVADARLVHTFNPDQKVQPCDLSQFQREQRRKKWTRRVRRFGVGASLAAIFAMAVGSRWPISVRGNVGGAPTIKINPIDIVSGPLEVPPIRLSIAASTRDIPEFGPEVAMLEWRNVSAGISLLHNDPAPFYAAALHAEIVGASGSQSALNGLFRKVRRRV